MNLLEHPRLSVNFYLASEKGQFAIRSMFHCPRVGDYCVFHEKRFKVLKVEWCLDKDAAPIGITRINIELKG